jgi:hypothetical protein
MPMNLRDQTGNQYNMPRRKVREEGKGKGR